MSQPKPPIYQLRITLNGIHPPIWRQLLVPSGIPLAKLHRVFQETMRWQDSHLHIFTIRGERYTAPMPDDEGHLLELGAKSTAWVKLSRFKLAQGETFTYEYDLGDSWVHTVLLEAILPANSTKRKLPVCLDGARACPPEDVGGVDGYDYFLEAIKDPNHPEHAGYLAWVGGYFNPEFFDVRVVNDVFSIFGLR